MSQSKVEKTRRASYWGLVMVVMPQWAEKQVARSAKDDIRGS